MHMHAYGSRVTKIIMTVTAVHASAAFVVDWPQTVTVMCVACRDICDTCVSHGCSSVTVSIQL